MRIAALSFVAGFAGIALGLLGCSSEAPPPFAGGGETSPVEAYPPGPYGVGVGAQVSNYSFVGYADEQASHASMQLIQFADFYNPHAIDTLYQPTCSDGSGPCQADADCQKTSAQQSSGAFCDDDRLYPPGSPYGARQPKPTVLAYDVASVWCGPCNLEAGCLLQPLHKRYAPCGAQFFLQLAQGPDSESGAPAVPKDLLTWDTTYKLSIPTAIAPANQSEPIWAEEAFPENILIDTTSMTIIDRSAGVPPTEICADESTLCSTTSAFGSVTLSSMPVYDEGEEVQCDTQFAVGVDQPCMSGAACQKFEYWQNLEDHLDKSRPGCEVK